MRKQNRKEKLNEEIKTQKIRLTGSDFKGDIVTSNEALQIAKKMGLDLVLISENNGVGICRIMNYEKFLYEQSKKQKPKNLELKEIKIGPNTGENDLEYRIKHITEFLTKGHKIKISLQFKGREMAYVSKGEELMLRMIVAVEKYGTPEAMPKLEGKRMYCILKPKAK